MSTCEGVTPTNTGCSTSSPSSAKEICTVPDCTSVARSRGLCGAHYQRLLKTGDPLGLRPARWDGYVRPTCAVEGCGAPAHSNGLCSRHVGRLKRHGLPTSGRRVPATGVTIAERLSHLVAVGAPDECWPWIAATLPSGYAQLCFNGQRMYAHRAAWEADNGPCPPGLVIDHRCHNEDLTCRGGSSCPHRRCCNPRHLEAVTPRLNIARATTRQNIPEGG